MSLKITHHTAINVLIAGNKSEYTPKGECPNCPDLAMFPPLCHVTH